MLIAAAISPTGAAHELLLAGLARSFGLVFSDDVFIETERNLTAKYPSALRAFSLFREAFADQQVFPSAGHVRLAARVVALKDAPIVAGALAASADFLATFDRKHLLAKKQEIRQHFGIHVMLPAEILERQRAGNL